MNQKSDLLTQIVFVVTIHPAQLRPQSRTQTWTWATYRNTRGSELHPTDGALLQLVVLR